MSELKLRRLLEHNQRLREDLARPRVKVSEASARCVLSFSRLLRLLMDAFIGQLDQILQIDEGLPCKCHPAYLTSCLMDEWQVPSVWGPVGRAEDPYGQQTGGCKCSIQ